MVGVLHHNAFPPKPLTTPGTSHKLPTGQQRVRILYEEYIHYPWLKQVWEQPVTDRPQLEPLFAAAFHGIELAFLLMAEFINDPRTYVDKRPRIESMALDIRSQVQLLGQLVDGELEVEGKPGVTSLVQDFPFEGCPPTTSSPAFSPALARLILAVERVQGSMSEAQRNSLIKVTLQITSAFEAAFHRWTVGLGPEHQFNALLRLLGVKHQVRERATNLDYEALVRPKVVEATLTQEEYDNAEDFFFRSIHLGTECWMFVANSRVTSAAEAAWAGSWQVAAAHVMQAAHILHYLGDHIMTLTRMNLRDYLQLKVQLEGTSGAGSTQVKAVRSLVLSLMEPLKAQLKKLPRNELLCSWLLHNNDNQDMQHSPGNDGGSGAQPKPDQEQQQDLLESIMQLYMQCEEHAELYNYAKALEDIESALLGGFMYKHYCLAANVIGSEAKGTMRRAVAGLKTGYETLLFPVLDHARSQLGALYDAKLAHLKGCVMDTIIARYMSVSSTAVPTERQIAMIPDNVVEAAAAKVMSMFTRNLALSRQGSAAVTAVTSVIPEDPACTTEVTTITVSEVSVNQARQPFPGFGDAHPLSDADLDEIIKEYLTETVLQTADSDEVQRVASGSSEAESTIICRIEAKEERHGCPFLQSAKLADGGIASARSSGCPFVARN